MLHEVAHNVRFIHMDGQPAPADTPRSFLGYSVGHWEGNTLVIVTDHFNDRTQIDEESLSHGLQLKVTERMTRFTNRYGGAEIRDLITIEDPEHYTRPWTAERLYPWRGDIRIAEYSCEDRIIPQRARQWHLQASERRPARPLPPWHWGTVLTMTAGGHAPALAAGATEAAPLFADSRLPRRPISRASG